jgi:branched-chain amino acid transport system substrate-binding protein
MGRKFEYVGAVAIAVLLTTPARCDVIKVGVIGPISGPFALFGQNFKNGINAWIASRGSKVGDHQVEFIYRDEEGANPTKSKALAQELIVKDKVQYLAGLYFTPNAMAIAPLLEEARVPMVVMNAATSAVVEKSPYIIRTSFTMWQNTVPAAKVAKSRGAQRVVIAVSDYGPGIDTETAFKKTFEGDGGTVLETIRMPLSTTDFSPIMQRIKDSGADMIFAFVSAGPQALGFVKAYINNGLKAGGVKLLSTGDLVTEPDLPSIGESGVGILSTYHYAVSHNSLENKTFLSEMLNAGAKPDDITMASVAAYDGARLIYRMIEATHGRKDPEKAMAALKGMEWISPRGPVSIDPGTRHIRQNVYLREVAKENGKLVNRELETFDAQPDWGLARN